MLRKASLYASLALASVRLPWAAGVVEEVFLFSWSLIWFCWILWVFLHTRDAESRVQLWGESDKTHTIRSDRLGKAPLLSHIKCHFVCRWHFDIISRRQCCCLRPLTSFYHRSGKVESRMCIQTSGEIMQIWNVWTPKAFVLQIMLYAKVITFCLGKWPTHFLFK